MDILVREGKNDVGSGDPRGYRKVISTKNIGSLTRSFFDYLAFDYSRQETFGQPHLGGSRGRVLSSVHS